MRRKEVTQWKLYVDESGNFDDSSKYVHVGAVAVPIDDASFIEVRFREALKRKAPLVPWPFHRWLATKAVMYPLWWEQRESVDVEEDFEKIAKQALSIWSEKCADILRDVQVRIASDKEPHSSQLKNLKETLKSWDYTAFEKLRDRSRIVCASISSIFQQTVLQAESEKDRRTDCVVFLAGESTKGDAVDDGAGDRYFATLVCTLERVADVFRRFPGEHVVTVHLASRNVTGPSLPVKMEMKLHHIKQACSRAVKTVFEKYKRPSVRFSTGRVWHYNIEVAPGIVMADSVSNYLWRETLRHCRDSTTCTLEELHGLAAEYFRFPLVSGQPQLSHASATGEARAAINEVRSGIADQTGRLVPEKHDLRWTATQANQWIDYFEFGGGVE